jgi:uncharacterized membrane protein YtjA (UPF0391 family)
MDLITKVISAIFGGTGLADTVANVGKGVALVTVIPGLVYWLQGHGNEVAHAITWGELVFWGLIGYVIIQVAHKAP